MPRGFDTTADCTGKAAEIRQAGYDFVGRYLSSHSWKVIAPAEAAALRRAGLSIVLVYEDGPTTPSYFSNGRGESDGARAAQQASLLDAPQGTTLYFAVDYDASNDDIEGVIRQYFQGLNNALRNFGAAEGLPYNVGVYGSGATCSVLTGAGLASQGWLADAPKWRGHASYTTWSISQGLPIKVFGLSVDPDNAVPQYGAIPPAPATA